MGILELDAGLKVHGGLTYSGKGSSVLHTFVSLGPNSVRAKYEDTWFFGFDCLHSGDLWDLRRARHGDLDPNSIYRTVEYVSVQCKQLAAQLHEMRDMRCEKGDLNE